MAKSIPKSSQLYFFIMPDENKTLLNYIIGQKCILIADRSKGKGPSELKSLDDITKAYFCPSDFKTEIMMHKTSNEIYFVDDTTSPAIELSCSVLRKTELSRGRIYFRGGYIGRDQWVSYPEVLYDIYKNVTLFMKKSILTNIREYQAYLSKDSQSYVSAGGVLSQF